MFVTYQEWADLIQASFEKNYYVPAGESDPADCLSASDDRALLTGHDLSDPADDAKYNVTTSLINRRGIYKDVYGSGAGREWSDYQLRANYRQSHLLTRVRAIRLTRLDRRLLSF